MITNFICNTQIVYYYKYSLYMNKIESQLWLNIDVMQERSTLAGFIRYYKDFIKRNESKCFFDVIKRRK